MAPSFRGIIHLVEQPNDNPSPAPSADGPMPPPPDPALYPETLSDKVRRFIREHPSASIEDTVAACGCSRSLVSQMRREISRTLPAGAPKIGQPATVAPVSDLDEVSRRLATVRKKLGRALTPTEQAITLSEIAESTKSEQARISALNSLRELQRATGAGTSVGPGPPLTWEEAIRRLADLIEAAGDDLLEAALHEVNIIRPARGLHTCDTPRESYGSAPPLPSFESSSGAAASESDTPYVSELDELSDPTSSQST